jgi:cysteine-rich repeat protein
VYVAAPNRANSKFYSNIYVISYNEGAGEVAQRIFDEILGNFSLAIDLDDSTVCSVNGTITDTACVSDAECSINGVAGTCLSVKAKVRRDTRRLSDLAGIRSAVKAYGSQNGVCSGNRSQLCSSSSECSLNETCLPIVPELAAGTYIRNFSASAWQSWQDILGGALNERELAVDPLNHFAACGVEGGPLASYDAATCVDQAHGTYVCPTGSHTYQYLASGNASVVVSADLEYAEDWANPIDTDGVADTVSVRVGGARTAGNGFSVSPTCQNVVLGASATCGDGVVGSGEVCEIGQRGGNQVACDANGDGSNEGFRSQICKSDCSRFVDDANALCVVASCGNGVKEGTEECDDGVKNGQYGFCGSACTRASGFSCGDGSLAGGEACDCGATAANRTHSSRAFGAGVNTCTVNNGVYMSSKNASCSWDCTGPASYCGDKVVDSGEACDGNTESYAGKLCTVGNVGEKCTTDTECGVGGKCSDSTMSWSLACPMDHVCTAGDADNIGSRCAGNGDCGTNGVCSPQTYQTSRVRTCGDGSNGAACSWTQTSYRSIACRALASCGNGVKEGTEECDDGNTDSTDSCTASCKANVCGDGSLYVGTEECDQGTQNGQSCSSSYGSTCAACSVSCRNVVSSGAFCGDGIRNGTEFCDGSQVQYTYFDSATMKTGGTCLAPAVTTVIGSDTYTCRDLGVCNGGPKNGQPCTDSKFTTRQIALGTVDQAECGTGYTCVKPTCSGTCMNTCPFTFTGDDLLLTANQPGARPSTSVDLYSYDPASTSTLPNAATLTVPACTAVGSFTATLSLDKLIPPDVYVVFVTDRSGSMGTVLNTTNGDTRLEVAQEVLKDSVSALFSEFGPKAHVGLVGFSDAAGTGMCTSDANSSSCNVAADCGSGTHSCGSKLPLTGETGLSTLTGRIDAYVIDSGTYTYKGINQAKALLATIPNADNQRKIIVLMSDGDPSGSTGVTDATTAATSAKAAGNELYTITLNTSTTLIDNMKKWSSNDSITGYEYDVSTGIDYAYDGDTASELASAYSSIIDSITGVTVSVVSTRSNGTVVQSSGALHEGANQALPWPSAFKCDGVHEQQVPVQITFGGEGQVTLSDVRVNYCAP